MARAVAGDTSRSAGTRGRPPASTSRPVSTETGSWSEGSGWPRYGAPAVAEDADRRQLPQGAAPPKFELPPIHRRTLSNGMQVLVVENHELPSVSLNVVFPVGTSADTPGKTGLSDLLSAVWTEGTKTRSSDQVAEALANIGARLSVSADWDTSGAQLYMLKRTLPQALEVFADILQNPAFPADELERQRNIAIGRLLQVRIEDAQQADDLFEVLMGDEVEPRKRFITENALNVTNLDI